MILLWSDEKDSLVQEKHHISFSRIQDAINDGGLLAIRNHPDSEKYPHQKILYVDIGGYVCMVPCVPIEGGYFLKTAYRSRVATRLFL